MWRDVGEAPPLVPELEILTQGNDGLAVLRPETRRSPVPAAPRRYWPTLLAGMGIVAVIGLGWQSAAMVGSVFPQMAHERDEDGLSLSTVSFQRLLRGGELAVRVEGRITNSTDRRLVMEPLDIVVTGGSGPVDQWRHIPTLSYLEPGQTIRFSTAKGDIGGTATGVEIRFAGLTKKAGM